MAERHVTCEEIKEELPAYVKDRAGSLAVRRHLSRCADCRSELARYESLVDMLGGLEMHAVEPPPGLAQALAAIPSRGKLSEVRTHVARNRARYLSGAAVLLAGAAGAAVVQRRRRLAPA